MKKFVFKLLVIVAVIALLTMIVSGGLADIYKYTNPHRAMVCGIVLFVSSMILLLAIIGILNKVSE